jgi:hypothetical protein
MEIYVLNPDLERIGLIDAYKSLIWANRYDELGDCELYVKATQENLDLLQIGNYLMREDDEMICRIRKRELTTDVESGDYLIATGEDAKGLIDQRIVNSLFITKRTAYYFITSMVAKFCINAGAGKSFVKSNGDPLLAIASNSDSWDGCDITASWENVGEKTREVCDQFGYGYKVYFDEENSILKFKVYKGTDRTANVVFSDQFENLASSDYIDDAYEMGNVLRVCGEGQGTSRVTIEMGNAAGIDRYEVYVDARDVSRTMTGAELKENYSGEVAQDGSGNYYWKVFFLNIPIYTAEQLAELMITHPGGAIITYSYKQYYQLANANVAALSKSTLDDNDSVDVNDLIYLPFLYQRGAEKLQEYGRKKVFTGTVVPDVTFVYKQDYFVGDVVTVTNSLGITAQARIVEIIEVDDETGHRLEPKFEYRSVE